MTGQGQAKAITATPRNLAVLVYRALTDTSSIATRVPTRATPRPGYLEHVPPSEHRYRIERRTGPAKYRQRCRHQEKLPSVAFGSRLAKSFQVAVVEEVHSQVKQREVVDGAR